MLRIYLLLIIIFASSATYTVAEECKISNYDISLRYPTDWVENRNARPFCDDDLPNIELFIGFTLKGAQNSASYPAYQHALWIQNESIPRVIEGIKTNSDCGGQQIKSLKNILINNQKFLQLDLNMTYGGNNPSTIFLHSIKNKTLVLKFHAGESDKNSYLFPVMKYMLETLKIGSKKIYNN